MFIVNQSARLGRLSGPQFRWLFERLEEDATSPEVIGLCRQLQNHPFDFGSVEDWSGESLRHLAETVERFRRRLGSGGASLLRPGADVSAWLRIVDEFATLLRSDPRMASSASQGPRGPVAPPQ
jgi:hypothetical protein